MFLPKDNTSLQSYILQGNFNEEINEAFKDFMLDTCRTGSNPYNRFKNFDFMQLEPIGLYKRLVYNHDTGKVEYHAGQDYPTEIARLKRFMLK